MNKLGIEIFSRAMYASWCYHQPTRTLFDAGDGLCLTLGARIFGIKRVMCGHGHSDHVNSLFSIIGLRAKTKGDTEKPLEIYYPADNYQFQMIRNYISASWRKLPYDLKWFPIEPGFSLKLDGAHALTAFAMDHHAGTTLGYKVVEQRTRLKEEYRGKDIPALLRSGLDKNLLNEVYYANTFAYCLDHYRMNPEDIRDCDTAIMDCTFLDESDRNDRTHATIDESFAVCQAAGVRNMIAAHISSRYSQGYDYAGVQKRFQDKNVIFCDNNKVMEF